jgi:uncharacterized heparinase superfamily protein
MTALSRYWHTLWHLRPGQITNRLRFRLSRPRPDLAPAPPVRHLPGPWVQPAARRQSLLGPFRFDFLNQQAEPLHWDEAGYSKLWRYNLHYFDDLNADRAANRRIWHHALIARWIADNPPASGSGWEPYPTSLRIVNWIKFALCGNELSPEANQSLAVQVRWLAQRIEWHLLGNHLFSNGKALLFAGRYFAGPEAEGWTELGCRILSHEIEEQICADGGHFERSTMYHALALEDALDLHNLERAASSSGIEETAMPIAPMRDWLAAMRHPDGEIALFNDAAIGIAPSPAELEAYAHRLGLPLLGAAPPSSLPVSGYERLEMGPAVVLADVAPLGPDYLPAHGHADTLTFEMSLDGRRLIVNSGTSVYGLGAERLRQRGTSAHNTVVLDGQDSSEVWGGFRVARRATVSGRQRQDRADEMLLTATHDGYRRLPGRPVHRRTWRLTGDRLAIADNVEGGFTQAEAMLHFHPGVRVERRCSDIIATLENGREVVIAVAGALVSIEPCLYHPEFGLAIESHKLVARMTGSTITTTLVWTR